MSERYRQIKPNQDALGLLRTLLNSPVKFVSGSLLAEQLGVSRPAIHGKLDKLREQGFTIEAIRNKGYRLIKEPEILHPDLLNYYAGEAGVAFDLLYFPVIDSTNSEAERQLASGRQGPFAVVSSCQTKGRGRLGRVWHSASTGNLYLTVVFEPNIPPQQLQHFTLWAGIHVCRCLQRMVPKVSLKIKWPNDLHCHDRKFAGMLTEAKMDADSIRSILFGIGLNVNSNPSNYPAAIRQTATSLYAMHGHEIPLSRVGAQIIAAAEAAYHTSIVNEPSEALATAWGPLDALNGQAVTAIVSENAISGVASGIDETGSLLLRTSDNNLQKIRAGDVTLKK